MNANKLYWSIVYTVVLIHVYIAVEDGVAVEKGVAVKKGVAVEKGVAAEKGVAVCVPLIQTFVCGMVVYFALLAIFVSFYYAFRYY